MIHDNENKEEKKMRLARFWSGFNTRRNGGLLPLENYGGQVSISRTADADWVAGWFSGAKKGSPL